MSLESVRKKLGAPVEVKTGFEDLADMDLTVRGQESPRTSRPCSRSKIYSSRNLIKG